MASGTIKAMAAKSDIPPVVNNLTSDSTTSALSAAQGKALNTAITSISPVSASIQINNMSDFESYSDRILENVSFGANGDARSNLPFASNGTAIVYGNGSNVHVEIFRANGEKYVRNKNSGTWDANWDGIALTSQLINKQDISASFSYDSSGNYFLYSGRQVNNKPIIGLLPNLKGGQMIASFRWVTNGIRLKIFEAGSGIDNTSSSAISDYVESIYALY